LKKLIVYGLLLFAAFGTAQIASYNHFPTLQPSHILDENLENISFALGLRILVSDYEGPLIRLRRSSDNTEMDFFCADEDKVDVDAINTWRGAALVYVVTWYDQSGLGRNAIQSTTNKQPRFYPDADNPYFQGDGANDNLDINTSIQILTNAGQEATILSIFNVRSNRSSNMFGTYIGNRRWASHVNWGDGRVYFDPGGICCNNPRSFYNGANRNDWDAYTFVRAASAVSARLNGVQQFSGTYTRGAILGNQGFGILYAKGRNNLYTNTKVAEMIMYNTDISAVKYQEIEDNQITFWNL